MRTKTLLILSAVIRLLLVLFGEVQDRLGPVPYTDIDYEVFTDAARFVSQGQSPYLRSTYRYTPLLAYLLLPNIWVSPLWGKLLFSMADVWVGYLVTCLVRRMGAGTTTAVNAAAIAWLYNPYTLTISTRGSCDVLVVALLLGTLWYMLQGLPSRAAVLYGLAVHLRVYPIIYAPSLVLLLAARSQYRTAKRKADASRGALPCPAIQGLRWPRSAAEWEDTWVHVILHAMIFGFMAGGTFLLLGWAFLKAYGRTFLEEAFLHHMGRKDPRHNFSIYFYTIYLTYFSPSPTTNSQQAAYPAVTAVSSAAALDPVSQALSQLGPLLNQVADPATLAFVPQLLLLLAVSCKLHAELPLCWLALTMVFVMLNKVCTAQYFVWWLSLLPLVLHHVVRPVPRSLWVAAALWVVAQLHWLGWAYLLEFKGLPVFLPLWGASIVFLGANVFLLVQLLLAVKPATTFLAYSLQDSQPPSQLPSQPQPAAGAGDTAVADTRQQAQGAAAAPTSTRKTPQKGGKPTVEQDVPDRAVVAGPVDQLGPNTRQRRRAAAETS